jgi:hypothetical protein
LRGLWEIGYGLPANIFFFINDKTSTSYLMNVRYYLDDTFIPDENRVYEDKGDYVQATNDEFDIAVPVSKSYSVATGVPSVVVTADSVPQYTPYEGNVGGRTDAYLYHTQTNGTETNALVVSTSLNTTYADGIWRMSQKGAYLAWDIYPEEGSTITFSMNGGKKSIAVEVGETNVFAAESWLTVIKDGVKQSVLTAGEWQTVVIAFVDNYDDSSAVSNITFSVNEGGVDTYVSNVRYYKEGAFIPTGYGDEKYAPYMNNESANASLSRVELGSFQGAYEYVNASGFDGALSFKGIKTEEGNAGVFFTDRYKFVKYSLYLDSNVQSITVSSMGVNETINLGEDLTNSGLYVFGADKKQATTLEEGKWYYIYIPVNYSEGSVENPEVYFSVNGAENTSAKAYIKHVSFEYLASPVEKLSVNTMYASLEMQKGGDFAGAYKYTNWSLGRGGEANISNGTGIYFNEVFSAGVGAANQTFFKNGYQYIAIDFYAEESVYSLELQIAGWIVDGNTWIEKLTAGTTFTSEYVFIYNQNGELVNSWTAGEWYTMVIKPLKCSDSNAWEYPLNIQANAETAESEAPVMYFKDATYSVKNPYAGN